MKQAILVSILLLAGTLVLSGCSTNSMYRTDYNLCDYEQPGDCPTNAIQAHQSADDDDYRLGIVEYDDQGQLRDPEQMNAVLDDFRTIAGTEDVLLITFIHGWHHNAKPGSSNVLTFRALLTRISGQEAIASKQQRRKKRQVLGLYIGWRGESLEIPYINELTFWGRKSTAHNVGQLGIAELLLKLEEITNVRTGQEEGKPPPDISRLVVIGHSLGGAVLFTSLQNILVDRFINSQESKTFQDDANGYGDLVVMLNPAFEALRYSSLYDLSQEGCRRYFKTQLPKIAILTSETDNATKIFFPLGRMFSTLLESHSDLTRHYCTAPGESGKNAMTISEGEADRTAVGHFKPYLTHRLKPSLTKTPRDGKYQISQIQKDWMDQSYGATLNFEGSKLISLGRSDPLNPYLNIRVDKALMDGHNAVWGNEIINFIRDFIVISTTPFEETGRTGKH